MDAFLIQQAGWFGTPEIILIVLAIVLLFGGKKIPELMRGIGKGVKEFKAGVNEENGKKEETENSTSEKK